MNGVCCALKKQFIAAVASIGILTTGFSNQASAHELKVSVQPGDTLWKIATINQLTVSELMQYNKLSTSTIYVGQELSLIAPHSHQSETTSTAVSYTVKAGDSLSLIARNYQTTVVEIKTINQLSTDLIKIGQVLKIPSTQEEKSTNPIQESSKTYVVKSGDSLWRIATNNHLTVAQLKSYNNLTTDSIYVGQVLKLTSTISSEPEIKTGLNADALITEAKKYIGVPYVWAGSSPTGFDCSGFLHYVYNKVGVTIPRTVASLWSSTVSVSTPQKGDLVFFTTYAPGPSHAGIYMGDNKFIHASSSAGVTITDMNNSYWKARYLGARAIK